MIAGRGNTHRADGKIPFAGHKAPGRLVVYYRRNGEIVCVVPGGRDEEWERQLQGSPDPAERIYVTFTDEPVQLATHRAVYRRGDTPVTPRSREVRRRLRAAERTARATIHYRDRHPKTALRSAREVYRDARAAACEDLSLEDRKQRKWFVSRFLRSPRPTPRMRRRLEAGIPAIDTLFTPLDYLPKVPLTKRQRRAVLAIANMGPLFSFLNDPESSAYRKEVLDAQRRRKPLPLPEIPPKARERCGPSGEVLVAGDQVWLDLYDTACLLKKMRARLHYLNCGCYVFAEPGGRPRCLQHGPAPSRLALIKKRREAKRARRGIQRYLARRAQQMMRYSKA